MRGLERSAQHEEPGRAQLRVHVPAGADTRVGQAAHEPVDAGRGLRTPGIVWTLLPVRIPLVAGVVHHERQVGKRGRGGTDVARRSRRDRRVGNRAAETLVRRDDARPERAHPLEEGEAHLVVIEEPTATR